jgi:uncharacterized protein YaaR (DUF327 family)
VVVQGKRIYRNKKHKKDSEEAENIPKKRHYKRVRQIKEKLSSIVDILNSGGEQGAVDIIADVEENPN